MRHHQSFLAVVGGLLFTLTTVADDQIAARVNGSPITEDAVAARMQPALTRLARLHPGPIDNAIHAQIRTKALDILIDQQVALTSTAAKTLEINDDDLAQNLTQRLADEAFGDADRYRAFVESDGTTWTAHLHKLKHGLIIDRLKAQLSADTQPPPHTELAAFFNTHQARFQSGGRVKISLIVLDPADAPNGHASAYATGVGNRIYDAGPNAWRAAVHEFSRGPQAAKAGQWDWTAPADLPFDFGNLVRRMKPAKIEKVAHGDYFYFIRLDAVEPKTPLSFAVAKDQVEQAFRQRQSALAYRNWLAAERRRATIEIAPTSD